MKTKQRVALYVRVSTLDKQHPANQTAPLQKWCKKAGWKIAETYIDRESGASAERPQFKRMMDAAASQQFDVIVCWSLDRFSREGIAETFIYLKRLRDSGVSFYSLTEEYFRTLGPAADFLIAVSAWIAEHERRRRQERIRAGMDRARKEGKVLGRHRRHWTPEELAYMVKLNRAGTSLSIIAQHFHTSKATVLRRLKEHVRQHDLSSRVSPATRAS
jgi:DNA invertase Pin-like site-specific DNA recombinase